MNSKPESFAGAIGGVICNPSDTSMYCQLTKFTSVIMQLLTLLFLAYYLYEFVFPFLKKMFKGGNRGSKSR